MSTSFLCLLRQTERWNLRVTFSSSLPWFSLQVRLLVQGFFFSAPPSHLYRTVPTVYGGTTTPFLKKIYKSLRDEDFAKYFLFTKTKKDICSFHFLIHRAINLLGRDKADISSVARCSSFDCPYQPNYIVFAFLNMKIIWIKRLF